MSLKAKLEAVIYAAEEPVTLGQLATLFADDAREWQAEQEAARAAQAAENTDSAQKTIEPLLLLNEEAIAEQSGAETAGAATPEAEASIPENADGDAPDTAPDPESDSATPEIDAAAPEAEAKRIARQRDREVRAILRKLLDELIAEYASDGRGVEIREIAGGYRMGTKPECHDAVRSFVKSLKPALKLSLPALETLAVIAYKQPITAPEVNEIRGVDSSGVFGSLLARKLIATAGRKQVIGRPILYKTTKEFLLRFGLKDVSELPSMEEFEKMAAIELEETEPVAPEDTAPAIASDLDEELSEAAEETHAREETGGGETSGAESEPAGRNGEQDGEQAAVEAASTHAEPATQEAE